ncbi:NUDIX hydrolase [Rummeliibacillus pycnus]|uniref:NUDIX hydrolase n=1 Tax=Rummeliibacillus pycnus TaxID=101070 RepID=UPI003D2B7D92
MESEILKTFDVHHQQTGVATRAEVHAKGLWHETFHCWLISRIEGEYYLYYQLRSAKKKDYASLFDITAAGHLLASEEPEDGIRELREELGLSLSNSDLQKLAIIPAVIEQPPMLDREFSHVYIVVQSEEFNNFHLQKEEVAGIVRAKLADVFDFFAGNLPQLHVQGFEILENGDKKDLVQNVKPDDFVRYEGQYMTTLLSLLKEKLIKRNRL